MTTYTVKNGSSVGKAFKVDGGHQVIDAGKDGEVTTTSPLTEEQIDAYAADGVKVKLVEKAKKPAKVPTDKEIVDGEADKAAYDALDEAGKAQSIADKKTEG